MGFESGSVSFRFFTLPRSLPEDAVERFAEHALSGVQQVQAEEVKGWVTGRHLMDRNITSESAIYGGFLRLCLTRAERKIPTALLQAEYTMEELAHLAATGRDYLNRKEKKEIRESIKDRLLPEMPPSLTGIPFIHDFNKNYLTATALNDKQLDALLIHFRHSIGFDLLPEDAGTLALNRKKVDIDSWRPVSFSPEMEDAYADDHIGYDFLTWLWYAAESQDGMFETSQGRVGVLIEGPLLFVYEGTGAHETMLRKGEPVNSAEAKVCLLAGKKLKSAKITLALDEERLWNFGFSGHDWAFRSVKFPESEEPDAITRFQDRMVSLDQLREMFSDLYDQFVDVRSDPTAWKQEQKKIFNWVKGRSSRR